MKKLVLCLGSGGVRGFTHIGVIKALEESSMKIEAYFGTSVGSLVSVFSASGMSALQIENNALAIGPFDLLDLTFPRNGFIKGHKLRRFIEKNISQKNIEDLNQKVVIVATNVKTGEQMNFKSGAIAERVHASCAIPNIFRPVKIDGIEYLDGDLKSPVPLLVAREQHPNDVIIGINIIARTDQIPRQNRQWSLEITKNIYRHSLILHEKPAGDICLDIDIGYFGGILTDQWPRYQIQAGYQETLKIIPKLKQLLLIA